ncbi:hypothetical protein NDU88_011902 [Pleurodeles waltl]|uniref:Uncharacterized protein n=1 Tax=Pleurodeles waltl TaxID=8319 RepID=A0AAV7R2S2_PLEWA|nr:hypothetical protein NDU88_011902 [Pleurodeles waltl]
MAAWQGNTMEHYITPTPLPQRQISDKVKVAEGAIVELQTEVGALRKQMAQATSKVGVMEARLEDAAGRPGQTDLVAGRVTGVDGLDWRNQGVSQTEDSMGQGGSKDSRIEIQQDGTMVVVVPELAAGLTVVPDLEVEMISVDS